ncbi:MAG: 4-(cytidine 5'-diphospho)-2-C-methyl-D-erythritol kinase [Luminiphilus sp.]|nr:4-(cytidine 5'-diphospho)-2-C-methyl-D-erythritol kinase [Luminiphilus sp.]
MGIQSGTITAIETCSPAKLNLFLHVTGRRPDGYHSLQTVFQLLNWGDDMRFEGRAEPGVTLSGDTDDIAPEQNLILKAAEALGQPERGAFIHIHKRIPRGGGLGGGSSNAATTLLALNRLWELGLELDALQRLAAPLGADVPVFVMGQSAWAEGVGEVLSALALPKRWFVIAQPDCTVSTSEIFADPALTRHSPPITVQAFFSGAGHNDLQDVVFPRYPEVQQAWEWLHLQSPTAKMTGSGACVFAALETKESARQVAAKAPDGLRVVVAEGVNRLPEMRVVE